jgi:hypothetical protein
MINGKKDIWPGPELQVEERRPDPLCQGRKTRMAAFLLMALCACIGGAILIFSTQWGIGVTTDSTVYVNVARNFLKGYGLSHPPGAPMTHYPPLYPIALSLSGLFGQDPLDGARWLHALLFCVTLILCGLTIYRETHGSTIAWVAGLLLLLSSSTMIYVYSFAWSESLFILLSLAGFLMLGEYLERSRPLPLLASSILIGLAFLTRYIGISLVITGCLCILLFSRSNLLRKCIDATIFGMVSLCAIILWIVRNREVAGTLTNRAIVSHPITLDHLNSGVFTVSKWLYMPQDWPLYVRVILLAIFAFVMLAGYAILFGKWITSRENRHDKRLLYYPSLSILFMVSYTLCLGLSISFVDAHTPVDNRILSPLYAVIVIGIVCLSYHLWCTFGKKQIAIIMLALASLAIILCQIVYSVPLIASLHYDGGGYSSKYWKHSRVMDIIKSLPDDAVIYTNGPDAIEILTGKGSTMLPVKVHAVTRLKNENFLSEFASIVEQINNGKAILVYFNLVTWRWYLPTQEDFSTNLRIQVLYQGWYGVWREVRSVRC